MEGISHRTSQRILILAVVVSLVGHLVMLMMTGLMVADIENEGSPVLTVELKELTEISENNHPKENETKPVPPPEEERATTQTLLEDTVDLSDRESKYIPYLKKLKKKISDLWGYPTQAYERKEEGDVVVKFSVNRKGGLEKALVLTSSGSGFLDQGALEVIDAAAPYDPFPGNLNLSKLHIIATFKYRLDQ
ncbi:MAG: energy transducer TonB [Deltaproteobacteria bacterium]|nr:energy transducer TonB [Deltaproteobacteria bacterium]